MHRAKAVRLCIREAGRCDVFLVATAGEHRDPFEAAGSAYRQIAAVLQDRHLAIFHERTFGSLSAYSAVATERQTALASVGIECPSPWTFVAGDPAWGSGLAGVQLHAVACDGADSAIRTVLDGDTPVGRRYERDGAAFLMLQAITGLNSGSPPDARSLQAGRAIDRMSRLLRENGASMQEVVRTWFYLADILDWYGEFNAVRNRKYEALGVATHAASPGVAPPASTGIRGQSPGGSALAVDILAITPSKGGLPRITRLSNPGQKDALLYGSAFSRGALIRGQDRSFLQLSGTAAIDEQGRSRFPGDFRSQLALTFDKIEAFVSIHGATLRDVDAATVFIKDPAFAEPFWQMARERGLEPFPGICVVADVCREELLVEIDAEVSFAPGP